MVVNLRCSVFLNNICFVYTAIFYNECFFPRKYALSNKKSHRMSSTHSMAQTVHITLFYYFSNFQLSQRVLRGIHSCQRTISIFLFYLILFEGTYPLWTCVCGKISKIEPCVQEHIQIGLYL